MTIKGMKKKHLVIISSSLVALVGGLVYFSMNVQFDLIVPDNAELHDVTLSSDNFSNLKENVGIFTVYRPHITSQGVNSGYCRIAEFVHEHEDGYNNTHVGNTTIYNATIPPAWCTPELNPRPVSEFSILIPSLLTSFISLVIFYRLRT